MGGKTGQEQKLQNKPNLELSSKGIRWFASRLGCVNGGAWEGNPAASGGRPGGRKLPNPSMKPLPPANHKLYMPISYPESMVCLPSRSTFRAPTLVPENPMSNTKS